ncbi:PilN domain-containing protein [Chamaesiphon sp.]|uniref:PilN domain-containing protein n=1 Tax=Chamaesiphon sp. TaxID=2814140 RepID=UPI003593F0CB
MYSLDINLLRERTEYQTGSQSEFVNDTRMAPAKYGKLPLFIGVGAAALTLLACGAGWLILDRQTSQLEAKQRDLDQKLGSLKVQDARLQELNTQLSQIEGETQSLAGVFNQVQPWSAVLQDLRESIPQGVQIASVTQSEFKPVVPATPVPAPGAPSGGLVNKISTPPNPEASPKPATPTGSPVATAPTSVPVAPTPGNSATVATLPAEIPTAKLEIIGTAKSFEEVNNFMLTLKQSAFFNPDETQLMNANLVDGVTLTALGLDGKPIPGATTSDKSRQFELPKTVAYTIQTSLKRIPAADLMSELERKGAVGLVTRLRSLQQQQVMP